MLRVFLGDDRVAAEKAVKSLLGANYEVFEGETLQVSDLPSIFRGTSLFNTEKRRILLKDLSENPAVWEKVGNYLTTEHEIVLWEKKIDKRSVVYKQLQASRVEFKEFNLQPKAEMRQVFNIFDTALRDGERAVALVEQIELEQDPYMFVGLMVTQALKRFTARPGRRERQILQELGKLDMQMKTSVLEPWLLVKAFLLRVGSI